MTKERPQTVLCQICGESKNLDEVIGAELVRAPIVEVIRKAYPEWSSTGFICLSDLNQFRAQYVRDILESEKGELTGAEEQVVRSLQEQALLSVVLR